MAFGGFLTFPSKKENSLRKKNYIFSGLIAIVVLVQEKFTSTIILLNLTHFFFVSGFRYTLARCILICKTSFVVT